MEKPEWANPQSLRLNLMQSSDYNGECANLSKCAERKSPLTSIALKPYDFEPHLNSSKSHCPALYCTLPNLGIPLFLGPKSDVPFPVPGIHSSVLPMSAVPGRPGQIFNTNGLEPFHGTRWGWSGEPPPLLLLLCASLPFRQF